MNNEDNLSDRTSRPQEKIEAWIGMRGSSNFRQGGPGHFFLFFFIVLSPQLILLKSKKAIIFQGSGRDPTFSRVVQLFPGRGVQLLIPYRKPI